MFSLSFIVLLCSSYSKILFSIFSVLYIISTFITYMRLRNNALMYLCIKNFVFMIYTSTLRTYLRTCTHVLPNKKAIYITQYSAALSLLFECINCKKLEFSRAFHSLYAYTSVISSVIRTVFWYTATLYSGYNSLNEVAIWNNCFCYNCSGVRSCIGRR
jgi:hypothetical protein